MICEICKNKHKSIGYYCSCQCHKIKYQFSGDKKMNYLYLFLGMYIAAISLVAHYDDRFALGSLAGLGLFLIVISFFEGDKT